MNSSPAICSGREVSGYRRLFIWVEGTDDERFFTTIVAPRLGSRYDDITVRRYAGVKNEVINNFLTSIKAMGADYLFVADIDNAPCVTRKKEALCGTFNRLDERRIVVVKAEIEGWYHAGLDATAARHLGTRMERDTQTLTKEQFYTRRPMRYRSDINYMVELLRHFDFDAAQRQNASFAYFVGKYGL